MFDFFAIQAATAHPLATALFSIILAFLLSTIVAVVYERTYRGLSYSRGFVQALILSAIVGAVVMQSIGDSLAKGLGMLGAMAIIRFRTNFRDPRDIIFMFAAIASGISCGVYAYEVGIAGTLLFCMVAVVLYFSPFGQTSFFDGMLRFSMDNAPAEQAKLEAALKACCSKFVLVTLRDATQGKRVDVAYHVKLRRGKSNGDLVHELRSVPSVKGVNLMLQESTVEM